MARTAFDRGRLIEAFAISVATSRREGVFLELAVYGGGAIMLHYAWRRGTEDVDAVLRPGYTSACRRPRPHASRR